MANSFRSKRGLIEVMGVSLMSLSALFSGKNEGELQIKIGFVRQNPSISEFQANQEISGLRRNYRLPGYLYLLGAIAGFSCYAYSKKDE